MNTRLITRLVLAVAVSSPAAIAVVGSTPVAADGPVSAQLPSDDPANWTPNVLDGDVVSIWQTGDRVVIAGSFTQIANSATNGGTVFPRSGLAAFDAATGLVDEAFAPVFDGDVDVVVPASDGTSIFVGGAFNRVNGIMRRKVARLDLSTGDLVTGFNARGVNGAVRDMRLVGDRLLIGGMFTSVGSQPRAYLASLDSTTGSVTPEVDLAIDGLHNGGTSKVIKIDVTPDGSQLLAIGNFTSIDGQPRSQIALIDLSGPTASLSPWTTDFFTDQCHPVFDSYLRDLDISDDGSFAVVSTTGAYRLDLACDTISRFELTASSAVEPTWVSSTGGDTTYAVEVHAGVAFVGGHMRWVNNPDAGDRHGPGGIAREGMAALDATTGLPFSWDPGRERGVGLFDFHVTEQGLWAGSDTDRWNQELRMKLAFFPWNGGSLVARPTIGDLPNDVFLLGRTTGTLGTADPSVLYRVNAGGPELPAADDGPPWTADLGSTSPFRNSGSSTATAPSGLSTPINADSVPDTDADRPPAHLWTTERYDPASGDEMSWDFPVPAGTPVQVRLYLSNRCRCTDAVGERIFDVALDGTTVLDDLDMTATYGHDVGAMEAFDIVSDGTVDIDFRHVGPENPVVNGIEIVRTDVAPGGTFGSQDAVTRLTFDGTSAPTAVTTSDGHHPWKTVRGAFMADSTLYTLHADGSIMTRSIDSTIGTGTTIAMWSNSLMSEIPTMTGIVYDPHTSRILYTLAGSNVLYARDFLHESSSIGARRSVAGGAVDALGPGRVRGMFLGNERLWFADADTGNLLSMPFVDGSVQGLPAVVDTTLDWRARAMFRTTTAQPNTVPLAVATASCAENTCTFDGLGSSDTDGTIVSYEWDFGDGTTGDGLEVDHSFGAGGTYQVVLTVTDDRGGTASDVVEVSVGDPPNAAPTASFELRCAALECNFDAGGSGDPDGTIVSYEWDFGDGTTDTGAVVDHAYGSAGTYQVTLSVTDDDAATGVASATVEAFPPTQTATFRTAATADSTTSTASLVVPDSVEPGDQLVYIVTINTDASITTPSGWDRIGEATDGLPDMRSVVFVRTAVDGDAGTIVAAPLSSSSKASRTLLAYANARAPMTAVPAVADAASPQLVTPGADVPYAGSTIVSYWSDKTSGNTGWALPATVAGRTTTLGSGGGRIVTAAGDTTVGAGTWPGATATGTTSGSKGIAWTIVMAPATGNRAPTAAFGTACDLLTCSFDATASSDPDGTIVAYEWDFGDGATATGPTASHDYDLPGTFDVTLRLTDDRGGTTSVTREVTASLDVVAFRAAAELDGSAASHLLTVPSEVVEGDQLLLFVTVNTATELAIPAGWTSLGSAEAGAPDVRTFALTTTAGPATADSTVRLDLGVASKTSAILLAYQGGAPVADAAVTVADTLSTDLTTPPLTVATDGSKVVSYWADKTSGNTGWALPSTVVERASSVGSGGGRIAAAAGDTAVLAGDWPGVTASGTVAGRKAIAWTVIVPAP